jgi:hypothetical protein
MRKQEIKVVSLYYREGSSISHQRQKRKGQEKNRKEKARSREID